MKAIGLFSGGLDSALAAALMKQLGIEVHAVYFRQPWDEADIGRISAVAGKVGVYFHVLDLGQNYLDMLKHPRYGYGKSFNPCIDCHRFMVKTAAEFMRETGARFVFTGEVVGQRPMSQKKQYLPLVEQETGLEGYLLRPLSANLLAPTIVEQKGWVPREKLLSISGRGRQEQIKLSKEFGIDNYIPPGGGCLATEVPFGARLKDFLTWSYCDPRETAVLKWGRYFRLSEGFVALLGRDERENDLLETSACPDDYLLQLMDIPGPLLLLKGKQPDPDILSLAGGIIQYYSKSKQCPSVKICYSKAQRKDQENFVLSKKVTEAELKTMERLRVRSG
ncbi:MAG: 7-cyano-7-deazaguanine synthase [Candidatus Omnitrophota bacterium]